MAYLSQRSLSFLWRPTTILRLISRCSAYTDNGCVLRSVSTSGMLAFVMESHVYFPPMMSCDRTQVRRGPPDTSPQQTGTSRTVKRYPSSSAPITSNALPSNNGFTNSRSSVQNWTGQRNGHSSTHSVNTHRPANDNLLHGHFSNALSPAGKLHKCICVYTLGYMCERPTVFCKKSIGCKKNKQKPWIYLIFPLSPLPTTSVAYIRTDRQMFAISNI